LARKYFGNFYTQKCYRGNKSINLVIGREDGLKLAKAIIAAALERNQFDIAIFDYRKSKENKIYATVTSALE